MNAKRHQWILYLIATTIVATIAVQFYWNYKNYEQNKQYVLNEIQESLNDAIQEYYAELSKESFFAIVEPKNPTEKDRLKKRQLMRGLFPGLNKKKKKDSINFKITSLDITTDNNKEYKEMDSLMVNSMLKKVQDEFHDAFPDSIPAGYSKVTQFTQFSKDRTSGLHVVPPNKVKEVRVFSGKRATDSLKLIKGLQAIFISVKNDSLNHNKIDSILKNDLTNKGIELSFYFQHIKNDSLLFTNKSHAQPLFPSSKQARSTFLKLDEKLLLYHSNPTLEALKRSSTGILLSLLLSLAVIASLFYLLKIINHQKELAEIKNDLISNITHEFKTPITTVSTAIEAIENFNILDDKEKTKNYLSISSVQLKKLHHMVEKLLETATLDSEKLLLKKEDTDLVHLIQKLAHKHQLISPNKSIHFSSNVPHVTVHVDVFHLENAISNLIDNAVKYGGDQVEVTITSVLKTIEIAVADNGKGIEKHQQEKIFDKFYRVPKGNTHDVKGFGIGLYYTKKIVEKHSGSISLISNIKNTIFKISLPNA